MLISCPKCSSVYDISNKKIPAGGKKFKCAECDNIWVVYPQDDKQKNKQSVAEQNKPASRADTFTPSEMAGRKDKSDVSEDINIMFNRLSQNTKSLFKSASGVDSMNTFEKIKHYLANAFSPYVIIGVLLPVLIVLSIILMYLYRYEITAKIPAMSYVYAKIGVESLYKGKDLVFSNVNIRNVKEYNNNYIEISGRIHNSGKYTVILLPVKAMIINKSGEIEQQAVQMLQEHRLEPDFGALFRIVMPRPNHKDSIVRLTLEKDLIVK